MDARSVITTLGMREHPEGGWFVETFRDDAVDGEGRARSSAIYYLLDRGESSAPHRIDAVEVWHHYAGGPLAMRVGEDDVVLGSDLAAGHRPQVVVPAGVAQSAAPLDGWVLVGCTVAPAFEFRGFELL
jgi:predicted cupin superfamily sugar epimerase